MAGPTANGRDYVVNYRFEKTSVKDQDLTARGVAVGAATNAAINPVDTVTAALEQAGLNPQRLPPRPSTTRANTTHPGLNQRPAADVGDQPDAGVRQTSPIVAGDYLDGLAAKGRRLVDDDAAAALRAQQPDGAARRGFDIGMGIAETDTAPGPGKQRLQDGLPVDERAGFAAAVSHSLARNRGPFTDEARRGAGIAARTPC